MFEQIAPEYRLAAKLVAPVLFFATYAHELTHAGIALLVKGRIADVDLWHLHIDYALPRAAANWRERAILLGPSVIGWSVAGALLAAGWRPGRPADWILVMGLCRYAIGGVSDYSLAAARGEEWWGSRARESLSEDDVTFYGVTTAAVLYAMLAVQVIRPHVISVDELTHTTGGMDPLLDHIFLALLLVAGYLGTQFIAAVENGHRRSNHQPVR